MVVHSCMWGTSFCACAHTWASGIFLRYSPLPCLETESLTQLEAWYFFLTYWLVSFCNPFVSAQRCWNHIYARSCLALLLFLWGFELWSSFLYSPSQITLSVIRNKCFSQKICKEPYSLFFIWKALLLIKIFTSLFLEPEMILSLLLWLKLNYWRC